MATLITNTNLNSAAALVPGPYGPLTRVGDAPDFNLNSDMPVEFTSALGLTVFYSYDDLGADWLTRDLEDKHAGRGYNSVAKKVVDALRTIVANVDASFGSIPYSDAEAQDIIQALQILRPIWATLPNYSHDPADEVVADFTVVDAGVGLVADVTNASTGSILYYLWQWGDGEVSVGSNPANHTYSGAGTKTVTLTVIGRGGISTVSKTVAIA